MRRSCQDLSNVAWATANIERVLGAVERYAEELPEVLVVLVVGGG